MTMPQVSGRAGARRALVKSAAAFRTISEVAEELDVPQHVLRFWESRFEQVSPLKRGGGRRYYRPEDVRLLRRIRELLYSDGYTIKGVQKLLRHGGVRRVPEESPASAVASPARATGAATPSAGLDERAQAQLRAVLDELIQLRALLRDVIG